jgi:hypothetical protein
MQTYTQAQKRRILAAVTKVVRVCLLRDMMEEVKEDFFVVVLVYPENSLT